MTDRAQRPAVLSADALDYLIETLPLAEVLRIVVAAEDSAARSGDTTRAAPTSETMPVGG